MSVTSLSLRSGRPPLLVVMAALLCTGNAAAQAADKRIQELDLEAGASSESTPDPLTPERKDQPAPLAPGLPATAAPVQSATPATEVDPVVTAVRARIAEAGFKPAGSHRDDLAALAAFYASDTPQPIFAGADGLTARGRLAGEEIRKADDWGLKASLFDLPTSLEAGASPEARADAEIKLGLAVLKYARHARGGRLDPLSISSRFDQKPVVFEPRSILQAVAATEAADAYLRELHPKHPQFHKLRAALVAGRGDSPRPAGDLQRILANMERWRWLPADLGEFYVWDSVPEQVTRVYDKGQLVLTEKIVVGKPSSPTPVFSADMQFVIFHPSWGVPPGMKVHELWPQLRSSGGGGWFNSKPTSSSVLAAHGLRVTRGGAPVNPDSVDWNAVDIRNFEFNQPPGPKNVLGMVKFRFPNRHDVYMHDTPERHLFGGAIRAFSHGCMRVQNPVHLAEVLLAHDKGFTAEQVQGYARRGGEIKLTTPIPVHITYFTATVDDADKLHFHSDVYGLDARVASAMEGRSVALNEVKVAAEPGKEPAAKSMGGARKHAGRASRQKTAESSGFNPFGLFGN